MLITRVATAAVGVPVIIALIFIGDWPYAIAVAFALGIAAAEWAHFWHRWFAPMTLFAGAFTFALTLAVHARGGEATFVMLIVGSALVLVRMAAAGTAEPSPAWAPGGILYAGVLGGTMVLLRNLDDGRDWVFLAILGTFAVDTCAYFTGRSIGRRKLAPRISPKKTWEGFFGGWIGGAVVIVALNALLATDAGAAPIAAIAVLLPLFATAGDLAESALKRAVGVKDASNLIPGHGGAMDRLDSLLFTFPLVWTVARVWVG